MSESNALMSRDSLIEKTLYEQKQFEDPVIRSVMNTWWETHSSIRPQFIDRAAWETKRDSGRLEEQEDGTNILYLTRDLHLWELIEVVKAVDNGTFGDNAEKSTAYAEKLSTLGKMFCNAGVYIAQRIEGIHEGQALAGELAEQFYTYGQLLVNGQSQDQEITFESIADEELTQDETQAVDRWIAGDEVYTIRTSVAERKYKKEQDEEHGRESEEAFLEEQRQEALQQLFLKAHNAIEEKRSSVLLNKVRTRATRAIESPKTELEAAVFRRGLKELLQKMPTLERKNWKSVVNQFLQRHGLDFHIPEKNLAESLHIAQEKEKLNRLRANGDIAIVSQKEREIALKIHHAVSAFPYASYEEDGSVVSEMIKTRFRSCLGASMLGGTLLSEAGITYLVGDMLGHSMLFVVTSNGKVLWHDMENSNANAHGEVTDSMLTARKKDGQKITIADIVAFSTDESQDSFIIGNIGDFPHLKSSTESQSSYLNSRPLWVMQPEKGLHTELLNNVAYALWNTGASEECMEIYRQLCALDNRFIQD